MAYLNFTLIGLTVAGMFLAGDDKEFAAFSLILSLILGFAMTLLYTFDFWFAAGNACSIAVHSLLVYFAMYFGLWFPKEI